MIITNEIKERTASAMIADMTARGFGSQTTYARFIGGQLSTALDTGALSGIFSPDGRSAIADAAWMKLARHFGTLASGCWNKADTGTFLTVTTALDVCQRYGIWQVLCDNAGIGKSYAARYYAERNGQSVIYIDCSQCPSKSEFIRELACRLGVEQTGTYNRLWREATDALLLIDRPLLILDEFGDVPDSVITLLKSLYNKADMGDYMALGLYMIGADNLKQRLITGRKRRRQSYAEFWSRFDNNITSLNFDSKSDIYIRQLRGEVEMIVDANLPAPMATNREEIICKTLKTAGSRAVRKNINIQAVINRISS